MIANVVLPNLDRIFDYTVPTDMETVICVGQRVTVPFGRGNKPTAGVVLSLADSSDYPELKAISRIVDKLPLVTEELLDLATWMKTYYFCTFYQALSCVIPSGARTEKIVKFVRKCNRDGNAGGNGGKNGEGNDSGNDEGNDSGNIEGNDSGNGTFPELPVNQAKIMTALSQVDAMRLADLVGGNSGLRSAIKALEKKGLVEVFSGESSRNAFSTADFKKTKPLRLTDEQQAALESINSGGETPFLLRGITGSGKTEVFLQAVADVLSRSKQAIVLVPEISLTPQIVERFVERFGEKVSVLHSALSDGERFDEWRKILRGDVQIAVGARSAIFAPFNDLGIIIIDEEQEAAYKSDTSPKFMAHEVAKWRAQRSGATLVMASATPSVVSSLRATNGEYHLLTMEKRATNAVLPRVDVIDMRHELIQGNMSMFSGELQQQMTQNLERGEQTILFLNRRGYNSFVSCRMCGESVKCKHCNVTLTFHRTIGRLICHHCDYSEPVPLECPACNSRYIRYFGDGTQKVENEIARLLPSASFIRMDMDTTGTKNAHRAILEKFRDEKIDILIGTQMVTKGLDFENVTLVGVLAADLSLNMNDFRAFERTFSQLTQVCGRAGRGGKTGRAVIQTYQPDHFVINMARNHDYSSFYNKEIRMRHDWNNPPFCDIVMILAVGEQQDELKNALNRSLKMLGGKILAVPPAPAPISKIKGLYRWRTLVKCDANMELREKLGKIVEHFRSEKRFSISVDVNPNNMF